MHPMAMHPHQDRSDSIATSTTDCSVVHSTSPFSPFQLLRNYRLFGTSAGPAVAVAAAAAAAAAAADFVTNPRYELLHPHNQPTIGTHYCSRQEYGLRSEGYKEDSIPISSSSKHLLQCEDSSSSSSPPVQQQIGASSSSRMSINALAISPNVLRQQSIPLFPTTLPSGNSRVTAIHQPAVINVSQQFSDSPSFAEAEVDGSRRFFLGDIGAVSSCRSRRPRSEKRPIPDEQKDDKYYERRKRNNKAAKKSRDARKIREDHIVLRATMLEHENAILRTQVLTLREEAQSLRRMLIEQQMPKLEGRYTIDCHPSTSLSLATRASSSDSNMKIVTSAAPDSSSNGTSLFSLPSSKMATLLV